MINLKKNDAIADVVRGIMEKELKGNQTKLDKNHNGKLDSQDFKILRGQKKATEDVEAVEENAFDYKSPRPIEPKGGSGVKQGSRYGGSKQKEKPEQEEPKEQMTLKKMKEKYEEPIIDELINEVLSKDADAGDYIHDFVHSDNPKFAGKSKAERKKMALGAYYAKKNEEYVEEGMLKTVAKKAFKALTGGSDEDQLRALQKRAGAPVTGKKPEPKKEEVAMESKGPTSQMDEPFVTDAENKPLNNAKVLASKTLKRMKSEMLGKAGTSE